LISLFGGALVFGKSNSCRLRLKTAFCNGRTIKTSAADLSTNELPSKTKKPDNAGLFCLQRESEDYAA